MAKASGLYRPDGRPARQFGEEIIEPGEPFSGETLRNIRSMVSDGSPAPKPPLVAREPDTGSEQQLHVEQASPKRHADPVQDQAPSEDTTQESPATLTAEVPQDASAAHKADAPPPEVLLPDIEEAVPEAIPAETVPKETLPDNFRDILRSLDDFARDKLEAMQGIQGNTAGRDLRNPDDPQVGLVPQGQPRTAKENWRRLIIIEGVPGRALRRFFSKPRLIALALLIGVSFWKPWFIPMLFLVVITALLLMAIVAGAERVGGAVGWWYSRLQRRNPARADRLLRLGNRLLTRVEWLADRLPPSWVQGFHIPDLDAAVAPPEDDSQFRSRLERIAAQESVGQGLANGT